MSKCERGIIVADFSEVISGMEQAQLDLFCDMQTTLECIFYGKNGGAYHSEYLKPAGENFEKHRQFSNGVYSGKHDDKFSTFFPKTWDERKVIEEIISANQNLCKPKGTTYNTNRIGKSSAGIYVAFETRQGKIYDVYPAFRQDDNDYEK